MKRKTRSVSKTEEMENVRYTRHRTSLDPFLSLPPELTIHFLIFLKPSEIRQLSQASKDNREFIVANGLLQYELNFSFSYLYYRGLMGLGIHHDDIDVHSAIMTRGGKAIKLNLSKIRESVDVSHLGGITTLDLSYCTGIIQGLDCLGGVCDLI
jgi:hypothetical protein